MEHTAIALRPPRHRLPRRAIGYWTVRALIGAALFEGGVGVAYALTGSARSWLGPALIVVAVVSVGYAAVVPSWRHAVHRWETTGEAVYSRSGWFVREWRVAPLSRVQTVDTVRGPLHRLFRLATVTVTTASAQGPVRLEALDAELAEATASALTDIVQAIPGDAT
jgi:membrane protein YdbS with pleckstrin-like domain